MSLYADWITAKENLDHWKAMEGKLREEICTPLLEGKPTGTHNFKIGQFKIKAIKKSTSSIDEGILSAVWDDLSSEEQDCIKFKPSIIAREYKACSDHSDLDQAIFVKPAMPGLKIELDEDE